MAKLKNRRPAQSILEFLVAAAIFVVAVIAISYVVVDAGTASRQSLERSQALLYAKEGLEAARQIRNRDFGSLSVGTYGLAAPTSTWILSGSSDTADGFVRHLDIAAYDASSRIVTSTVDWNFSPYRKGQVAFTTILANMASSTPSYFLTINASSVVRNLKIINIIYLANSSSSAVTFNAFAIFWPSGTLNRFRVYNPTTLTWFNLRSSNSVSDTKYNINGYPTVYSVPAGATNYQFDMQFTGNAVAGNYQIILYNGSNVVANSGVFIVP
ncbi:MAG: hypothetical protein WCO55_00810 [Candidatus Falkowbacteria bacterium]